MTRKKEHRNTKSANLKFRFHHGNISRKSKNFKTNNNK
jgi:hypothetical protein